MDVKDRVKWETNAALVNLKSNKGLYVLEIDAVFMCNVYKSDAITLWQAD